MPTYEYECQKCKKNFDFFQSMKDAHLVECPASHCQMKPWGKGKVKRLLGTGAGLIFKGSGFYITDYRSEGYKQAAKDAGTPPPPSSESKSTEAKPSTEAKTPEKKPPEKETKKSSDKPKAAE